MTKLFKALRSEKGFTLIELLVVIGILAALAGVVTLAVTQFIGRGVCEGYCTEKHNVQTAAVAAKVEGQDCQTQWTNYVIGETKYNWSNAIDASCKVGDASDAPSENCTCKE